jgi:hypothetical protein
VLNNVVWFQTLQGKLKDIIKRHEGTLVDNEDDATHIIYPPTDPPEGRLSFSHGIFLILLAFKHVDEFG